MYHCTLSIDLFCCSRRWNAQDISWLRSANTWHVIYRPSHNSILSTCEHKISTGKGNLIRVPLHPFSLAESDSNFSSFLIRINLHVGSKVEAECLSMFGFVLWGRGHNGWYIYSPMISSQPAIFLLLFVFVGLVAQLM